MSTTQGHGAYGHVSRETQQKFFIETMNDIELTSIEHTSNERHEHKQTQSNTSNEQHTSNEQ